MKLITIIVLSSLLLVGAAGVASVAVATKYHRRHRDEKSGAAFSFSHGDLRSACGSTRFPELCFSEIASRPSLAASVSTHKDVIEASLNLTVAAVEHSLDDVESLITKRGKKLSPREKIALHDCLENIDDTLDELRATSRDLKYYSYHPPSSKKKRSSSSGDSTSTRTISEEAEEVKTLLSAAMTNQASCLDGFSYESADKEVREALEKGLLHVNRMCCNALAMVCNMITHTDTDTHFTEDQGFPRWLSAGDRRLLQARDVTPDVTVAADGSGDYRTVSAAVEAAPEKSNKRFIIRIKAGVYREKVEVTKKKTNLMFVGEGRKNTIITGSRNVVDGSTTFDSATVAVVGEGFVARGLTFENTAGPSKHQAVALRVGSDRSAFYDCDMLGYQDTLYAHSLRQFYRYCLVAGTVDFIFGNAAAIFQDCDIRARRPNPGQRNMITAQGRDDPNQNTGIVLHACRIGATSDLRPVRGDFPTYLGRPWKEYSRTVVMKSEIGDVVRPEGWYPWNSDFALDTLYYGEYQNRGGGAGTAGRVKWKGYRVITRTVEANHFTAGNFISGRSWLSSTGFPFSLGL